MHENQVCTPVLDDPWDYGKTWEHKEWRQLDHDNIMIQKENLLEWIAGHPARLEKGLKELPPAAQVAEGHLEYFFDEKAQSEFANHDWAKYADGRIFGPRDRREDLKIAMAHAEACVAAISDEPGPWQQNDTLLDDRVMKTMRDPWSTAKIASWPAGQLMSGHATRRIGRATALFRKFERGDRAQFLAPQTWKDQDVISATHWYKEYMLKLLIAQRDVLSRWTPETSVPLFDLLRAAGNAGHWNNLPNSQQKGGRQEREPPLTTGTPNHDRFEAFLECRKLEMTHR